MIAVHDRRAGGVMTAGQGGPPDGGQAGGQPEPQTGGRPGGPYGPPYGQAPGQPYGQPWPGYAPAPSAPGPAYGAPAPLERPLTVRAGLGAFIGSIVLSVISTVVTFLNWDTISAQIFAKLQMPAGADAEAARAGAEAGARIGIAFGLVFAAVYGLFVLFAWRGRNWARIVLWVLGGLGFLFDLVGLAAGGSPIPFLTGLSFFQVLLLLAAIVFLALKPSNEWFRYQAWLRATGQAR
jgi:hypothetical protein